MAKAEKKPAKAAKAAKTAKPAKTAKVATKPAAKPAKAVKAPAPKAAAAKSAVLTKTQIIAGIAEKTELQKKKVAEVLDLITELTYKNAKNGFTLPGIGKVVVQNRGARVCRNPQTGEPVKVPARKVLKFRFAKAAKDAIIPPKAAKK
ncbi:MAG: HU family DNA-binding protein [Verrucomicrobia bacterium]|nr:HU family DNA-binding protein [Verrucomicrobiota bacterium]